MRPRTSYLTPRAADSVLAAVSRAMATVQTLLGEMDTPPVIQLARVDATTGRMVPVGEPYQPIALVRDSTRYEAEGENQGIVTQANTGTLVDWPEREYLVSDRFQWDGWTCEVTEPGPVELDVRRVRFRILQDRPKGGG